jgi:hypothetical protein
MPALTVLAGVVPSVGVNALVPSKFPATLVYTAASPVVDPPFKSLAVDCM